MGEHVERYRIACKDWLDKQSAADILNDTRKIVFAQIASLQNASSEAAKSRLALLSDDWKEHVEKTSAANDLARRANMGVKLRQMEFDEWRSMNANNRNERGNYK